VIVDDTFAGFVAALEDSLDDLEGASASPDDLARRAHLSRFHFDRVIKAVAGEPPQQFRRRVLLERAAYRLITTDRTIIDVATEAGYTSHEAFTRAFHRAYAVAPSQWRERPTRFQLESPSGVHFHPPGGLRLPAAAAFEGFDLAVRMVEHHVWLVTELVERAQRLTDDQLDAPLGLAVEGIDDDSLRWLLWRLVGQMEQWTQAVHDRPYDFAGGDDTPTRLLHRLRLIGPAFLDEVRTASREGRYDETFVDAMSPTPQVVTYGGMVAHVLTFSAHHRLLAVTALARHGITDLGYGDPKYWIA
jgi:AraC family transcriptional regulator